MINTFILYSYNPEKLIKIKINVSKFAIAVYFMQLNINKKIMIGNLLFMQNVICKIKP